jgi:hypothetical protein
MNASCHSTRRLQAKTCSAVSSVSRQEGHESDSAWPMPFMRQRVDNNLRAHLIKKFEGVEGFVLGVPVNGVEDPVVPSILSLDALFVALHAVRRSLCACSSLREKCVGKSSHVERKMLGGGI